MLVIVFLSIFSIFFGLTNGLDNGLARTPPMGWMQWERFRCVIDCDAYPDECISENLFKTMADFLVADGYLAAGYQYIMIDDCWAEKTRDENNRLRPDAKRFPNGIPYLADYLHNKGLKLGIYGDIGNLTCAGYPGSIDYLKLDADTFAEWKVDYLKFDGCYAEDSNLEYLYQEMGGYLNESGRPIVYSCSWPAYEEPNGIQSNYSALAETCNLWRNWDDIQDSWTSLMHIYNWFKDNQNRIQPFAGPGHWNDPDMLISGNYGLSYEQAKAQMTIWSIMAAPLIMSNDLRTIDPKFRDILLNRDAIRVNQDPLGIQGKYITYKSDVDFWTRPIRSSGLSNVYAWAIGFLSHREDGFAYRVNFTLQELNIDTTYEYILKDVWNPSSNLNNKIVQTDAVIYARVAPTGSIFLIAEPIIERSKNCVD